MCVASVRSAILACLWLPRGVWAKWVEGASPPPYWCGAGVGEGTLRVKPECLGNVGVR